MNQEEIMARARASEATARRVLAESGIAEVWREAGCRVSLVGSLRMGLLAAHRDIDLHVYSRGITPESSFAIMARVAANPGVTEIKCINGLNTSERCIAWHALYRAAADGELWQFDIIHIEEGTAYDGYFERMADRICQVMTPRQKQLILKLKFGAPPGSDFHGVEYYEAVISGGVSTLDGLSAWVAARRALPPYYWIP